MDDIQIVKLNNNQNNNNIFKFNSKKVNNDGNNTLKKPVPLSYILSEHFKKQKGYTIDSLENIYDENQNVYDAYNEKNYYDSNNNHNTNTYNNYSNFNFLNEYKNKRKEEEKKRNFENKKKKEYLNNIKILNEKNNKEKIKELINKNKSININLFSSSDKNNDKIHQNKEIVNSIQKNIEDKNINNINNVKELNNNINNVEIKKIEKIEIKEKNNNIEKEKSGDNNPAKKNLIYEIILSLKNLENKEIYNKIISIDKKNNYELNLDNIFSLCVLYLNKNNIEYKYGLSFKLGYLELQENFGLINLLNYDILFNKYKTEENSIIKRINLDINIIKGNI
jgi:hypothetical protein